MILLALSCLFAFFFTLTFCRLPLTERLKFFFKSLSLFYLNTFLLGQKLTDLTYFRLEWMDFLKILIFYDLLCWSFHLFFSALHVKLLMNWKRNIRLFFVDSFTVIMKWGLLGLFLGSDFLHPWLGRVEKSLSWGGSSQEILFFLIWSFRIGWALRLYMLYIDGTECQHFLICLIVFIRLIMRL